VELKQKLKFTQINLDPISIDITDTQATHLDWKKWKEDALQDCKNKKRKRLEKKLDIINKKVQNDFAFDPKRTVRRIIKDSSPICEIDTNELENFWSDRWSREAEYNEQNLNDFYRIETFWNDDMNNSMITDLIDQGKMEQLIQKRVNLSAPGLDFHTFPILKLEKTRSATFICKIMRSMLAMKRCPKIWKKGKTILLYKGGNQEDPANCRPITLTSIFSALSMAKFPKL
jgi:hypothetical protein